MNWPQPPWGQKVHLLVLQDNPQADAKQLGEAEFDLCPPGGQEPASRLVRRRLRDKGLAAEPCHDDRQAQGYVLLRVTWSVAGVASSREVSPDFDLPPATNLTTFKLFKKSSPPSVTEFFAILMTSS